MSQQGVLALLITDWYVTNRSVLRWFLSKLGHRLGRYGRAALASRSHYIPDSLVRAFPIRSLFWKLRVRIMSARGFNYEAYLETDSAFASCVANTKLPAHDVFFGYSYASLEALRVEKARGHITILCQIDPGPTHFRIVSEEMERFPNLAGLSTKFPSEYFCRLREEWKLADIIVVNSEWSRDALLSEGICPSKVEILPLAFELRTSDFIEQTPKERDPEAPLRILWLGQVTPGKGIHYLIESARLLEGYNVRFDVVGPIKVFPDAVSSAPANMVFHGAVSRDSVAQWYRQSDVFVLPTLSDGFALTQLEAMAHGLPVIATPNCGRVAEEGITGFIIPPRDSRALANAILRFASSPTLSTDMAPACCLAVKTYSVENYGRCLMEIITRHV